MDISAKVQITINTLNHVTVCGKKNLDYMLGCIQTLEAVRQELEAKKNAEETDPN